jgi:nucleoside-diphosphate-sugar epimerase
MANRLIFGCGYLGRRTAELWRAQGDRVYAVTRSPERAAQWQAEGLLPIVADVADARQPLELPAADTVLYAIGYDRTAAASIEQVYAGGVARVLAAAGPEVRRFVYVSSTGVYGDADGDAVDERTPPAPLRPGGAASLAAERALAASPFADRGVILRMAGLYGPGRIPLAEKLRRGEPLPVAAEGWLNLIYIDDAARVAAAAADLELPAADLELPAALAERPLVLCVSDGCPVARAEYYRETARLLGVAPPAFAAPAADAPSTERAAVSRRVSNARLVRLLPQTLRVADYRAGLAAALRTN